MAGHLFPLRAEHSPCVACRRSAVLRRCRSRDEGYLHAGGHEQCSYETSGGKSVRPRKTSGIHRGSRQKNNLQTQAGIVKQPSMVSRSLLKGEAGRAKCRHLSRFVASRDCGFFSGRQNRSCRNASYLLRLSQPPLTGPFFGFFPRSPGHCSMVRFLRKRGWWAMPCTSITLVVRGCARPFQVQQ
jgi:hypothetical protein